MAFKTFDTYTLKARYYPTMIVIAPLCLVILSLAAGRFDLLKSLAAAAISGLGLGLVMDQTGRDGGRNKEPRLFEQWCGKPSTVYLRHRDSAINTPTKARYHKILGRLLPDLEMPSKDQEIKDPGRADEIFASCADYLREITRADHIRFPLVFQENCNYGFRRNLWGMRPAGVAISLVSTAVCGTLLFYEIRSGNESLLIKGVSTLICAVLSFLWIFRFNTRWVRIAADAYARRLLEVCDSIRF